MIALGIFPFILAFASKFNLVTFVTGYSHEKLQIFHQWFSYLFFILSLLHTFPFVMAGREHRPNTDGKNPMGLTQIGYSWHIGKVVSGARVTSVFRSSVPSHTDSASLLVLLDGDSHVAPVDLALLWLSHPVASAMVRDVQSECAPSSAEQRRRLCSSSSSLR
jgi:hypothetical protein